MIPRRLFLDFDGALHHLDDGDFKRRPRLIALLTDHEDVRVVVTSGWRRLHERHELKAMLGDLARHYLADTPALPGKRRYGEILQFLRRRQWRRAPWVALDDDRREFSG